MFISSLKWKWKWKWKWNWMTNEPEDCPIIHIRNFLVPWCRQSEKISSQRLRELVKKHVVCNLFCCLTCSSSSNHQGTSYQAAIPGGYQSFSSGGSSGGGGRSGNYHRSSPGMSSRSWRGTLSLNPAPYVKQSVDCFWGERGIPDSSIIIIIIVTGGNYGHYGAAAGSADVALTPEESKPAYAQKRAEQSKQAEYEQRQSQRVCTFLPAFHYKYSWVGLIFFLDPSTLDVTSIAFPWPWNRHSGTLLLTQAILFLWSKQIFTKSIINT